MNSRVLLTTSVHKTPSALRETLVVLIRAQHQITILLRDCTKAHTGILSRSLFPHLILTYFNRNWCFIKL